MGKLVFFLINFSKISGQTIIEINAKLEENSISRIFNHDMKLRNIVSGIFGKLVYFI